MTARNMWGELFDQAKKDLTEFVDTITHDTSDIIQSAISSTNQHSTTSSAIAGNKRIRSFSHFLVLYPKCIEDEAFFKQGAETEAEGEGEDREGEDRKVEGEVEREEGEGEVSAYEKFKSSIDVKDKSEEISVLLKENQVVDEMFREYVPVKLSYIEFWTRFFYIRSQVTLQLLKEKQEVDGASDEEEEMERLDDWNETEEERAAKADGTQDAQDDEERKTSDKHRTANDTPETGVFGGLNFSKVTKNVGNILKTLDDAIFNEAHLDGVENSDIDEIGDDTAASMEIAGLVAEVNRLQQQVAELKVREEIMSGKLKEMGCDVEELIASRASKEVADVKKKEEEVIELTEAVESRAVEEKEVPKTAQAVPAFEVKQGERELKKEEDTEVVLQETTQEDGMEQNTETGSLEKEENDTLEGGSKDEDWSNWE